MPDGGALNDDTKTMATAGVGDVAEAGECCRRQQQWARPAHGRRVRGAAYRNAAAAQDRSHRKRREIEHRGSWRRSRSTHR